VSELPVRVPAFHPPSPDIFHFCFHLTLDPLPASLHFLTLTLLPLHVVDDAYQSACLCACKPFVLVPSPHFHSVLPLQIIRQVRQPQIAQFCPMYCITVHAMILRLHDPGSCQCPTPCAATCCSASLNHNVSNTVHVRG